MRLDGMRSYNSFCSKLLNWMEKKELNGYNFFCIFRLIVHFVIDLGIGQCSVILAGLERSFLNIKNLAYILIVEPVVLHISERTLLDYRTQGISAYVKSEKNIMYRESDVQKMLERMYVKAWKD